jgi:hypothetical protein
VLLSISVRCQTLMNDQRLKTSENIIRCIHEVGPTLVRSGPRLGSGSELGSDSGVRVAHSLHSDIRVQRYGFSSVAARALATSRIWIPSQGFTCWCFSSCTVSVHLRVLRLVSASPWLSFHYASTRPLSSFF